MSNLDLELEYKNYWKLVELNYTLKVVKERLELILLAHVVMFFVLIVTILC